MQPITENTEFIIGIDFGHGETSACFYNLKKKVDATERKDVTTDLDVTPGNKVVYSAVAIVPQEGRDTISIGQAAVNNAAFAKKFRVAFKKRPSQMVGDDRELMRAFMKGVYESILSQHPDYKTRDHRVVIARPSNDRLWKSEEFEYIKIAEEAGLPVCGIQNESRAAYFRARTQSDSKIDHELAKGVLIVDFGSSTIDFTYLNKQLTKPIDDGCDLGASEVERVLMQYALDNPEDDKMAKFKELYGHDRKSIAYNQMNFAFRQAKEQFYGKDLPFFSVNVDMTIMTSAETEHISGHTGVTLLKTKVREILEDEKYGAYINKVKSAVEKFKTKKLKDYPVSLVYLTGGASRMDFVRNIFMEVFKLNNNQVLKDENPSLIVSEGVASLTAADYSVKDQEQQLRRKARLIINQFSWKSNISTSVQSSVKQSVIDKAHDIMEQYRYGNIYEWHDLKNGYEGDKFYGPMEHESTGYLPVHNVNSLIREFTKTFGNYVNTDFGNQCEESIKEQVLSKIYSELKYAFISFNYEMDEQKEFKLHGLSAKISNEGVNTLTARFTKEGDAGILYEAVKSCYPGGVMLRWNLLKDRWKIDRDQQFRYYEGHYKRIFSESDWAWFMNEYLVISGIEESKKQLVDFVDSMIDEYINYAKLSIFFK